MSSSIQLTFYEKMVLKGRSFKKKLQKLNELGRTKISLLLIPHNHDHIVKLELTVYLIAFISLVSFSTISMGVGYLTSYIFIGKDKTVVFEKGRYQKSMFLHHYEMAKDLKKELEKLNKNIDNLNIVTWGKSKKDFNSDTYIHTNSSPQPEIASFFGSNDEMRSNMKVYKQTVEDFSEIHTTLSQLKPYFLNAADYIETRESIVQSMPRGRPLGPGIGFIASTFGNREDPVLGGGEFHNGVDFATGQGTPIYASAPGIIGESAYSENSLGNYIRINHANGFFTIYAHCSEVLVKKGDKIKRGDLIGRVGSTGKSTGPHLHYEVHIGLDAAINPQEFINID
ncbi:MAG: M23 family metallopeptidase [Leptospiraceae bacterium]|nr:M23 family metallopeptidase [Leptospiraceae bacterium]